MRPDANTVWFTFSSKSDPPGGFGVYAFSGNEAVCAPYEFEIELVSRSANVDITALTGKQALLSITDRSGGTRLVHGIIRHMEQRHTANSFTHYKCWLVPRLWFLDQIRDHRIFQNLPVDGIIQKILREQGFAAEQYAFKLCYTYQPREYCVQYGETDLHFITRLCEEEGIYFYFEHSEDGHCLCFCDREGGPKISGEWDLRFFPGSGQASDTAVINRLHLHYGVNSNAAMYREWNFQTPKLDLTALEREPDAQKAPTPPGMLLEQYQYPHLYEDRDQGRRYAKLQLDRQLTFTRWIDCQSDVSRHLPSYIFSIHEHPRKDVNARWWVVTVHHEGEQPGVLEHEAPDGRGQYYQSSVQAIPDMTRFIPRIAHPKNLVKGLQSAIVTGLGGEEVFCDKYGRVKVQFHWDRLGAHDEKTTCWVRVADSWAGVNFGFIQIPRIGQEVMVEFMEGDPDRPVITGRVYNAAEMPPWRLPEQKTLSGIQSREFKADRRNQMVLDDTQGAIQAQLSSDHNLSQLNLGYISRIEHIEGRKEFRGEGFELRTDGWGVIRADRGIYISTEPRKGERHHQKDIREADNNIRGAASQHEATVNLAKIHNAQDDTVDGDVVTDALRQQHADIHGNGKEHGEFAAAQMLLSSPAGIALTTIKSVHTHSAENTAITAGRHISLSTGRSILGSALDRISLFAHKLGMRFFAGKGKIEIQAQSNDIEMIAEKVVKIISTKKSIQLTAAEEIVLVADGSYIRINGHGIEQGTNGKWAVYAASRAVHGPKGKNAPLPDLPSGAVQFDDEYRVVDKSTGDPVKDMRYELHFDDGSIVSGVTGEDGMIPKQERLNPVKVAIKLLGKKE